MYDRISHRNSSFQSRPVSQRTVLDSVGAVRNVGDPFPVSDPKMDCPDRQGHIVSKPHLQIDSLKLNDVPLSTTIQSTSILSARMTEQRSSHRPSQSNYERLYYEQINHTKEIENELKSFRDVLHKVKIDNDTTKINYEEFIANLQLENQRLKASETRVVQLESQKRRLEDDIKKITTENKLMRQEHEESNSKLLEELKAKIRYHNQERMECLSQVDHHQEEIQELRDQLETMVLDHSSERSHLIKLLEEQKLQNGEMSLGYEQMLTDISVNNQAIVREKDRIIEELKKNIEELKLQLGVFQKRQEMELNLQAQMKNEISFSLKDTITQKEECGKKAKTELVPLIDNYVRTAEDYLQADSFSSPVVMPVVQAYNPLPEYVQKPLNYENNQTHNVNIHIPVSTYPSTNYVNQINSTSCSNHNSSSFTASSRTVTASPTTFASRRVIRLGDAENPFTNHTTEQGRHSHRTVVSSQSNRQTTLSSSPVIYKTLVDTKPEVFNHFIPNTVSLNQSLHFPDSDKPFMKKEANDVNVASYRVIDNTGNAFYPARQMDTNKGLSETMKVSYDDPSIESSIGMNRDDSALTTDSKIREVVNELQF